MTNVDCLATSTRDQRFRFHDFLSEQRSFAEAVIEGLSQPHKAIPCRFLYDSRGSALFERICGLPEYYLTRTEISILRVHAAELAQLVGPGACLIELGSGSSAKTRILLDALRRPVCYAPIDVSRQHLFDAALGIADDYPALRVEAICADYNDAFPLPAREGRRVAFFPGSTLGNLTRAEAHTLLTDWRRRLGAGGMMIVGIDCKKDADRLEAAYDDTGGVTRAFITNILRRANRELGADFDLDAFRYDALYAAEASRVEMYLTSLVEQRAGVAGHSFHFAAGERLHVENSHKYTLQEARALGEAAGFTSIASFADASALFGVHVWSV